MQVEEIALLCTTFVKGDGRRLYYPNPKLIAEPCINVSRCARRAAATCQRSRGAACMHARHLASAPSRLLP